MESTKKSKYCMLDENSPKIEDGCLNDLRKVNLKELYLVNNPKQGEKFSEMKKINTCENWDRTCRTKI